jgi:hypothetical protein
MRHGGAIPVAVAPENGCATPRIPPKRLRLPCTPIVSAISFFRANVVLSGVMASFPDQSGRVTVFLALQRRPGALEQGIEHRPDDHVWRRDDYVGSQSSLPFW